VSDVTLIVTLVKPTSSGTVGDTSFTMLKQGTSSTYVKQVPGQSLATGDYTFRITAHDTKGNLTTVSSRLTVFNVSVTCGD
jgi:hypothetical protein